MNKQRIIDIILGGVIATAVVTAVSAAVVTAANIGWGLGTNGQGTATISPNVSVPFGIQMSTGYASSAVATTTAGSLATSSVVTFGFSNVASGALATATVPLTYYFEVSGVDALGGTSLPSNEITSGVSSTAANNEIVVNWATIPGANSYDLYVGTSSQAESLVATTTATSFTLSTTTASTSTGITSGIPPTVNTAYVDIVNPNGNSYFGGNIYISHLNGNVAATIATGTAAGSAASMTVAYANDVSGAFTLKTGTSVANGPIVTVTFGGAYPKAPACDFQGENSTTADIAIAATPFPVNTATSVTLESNATALGNNTTYKWGYQCSN